MSTYVTCQGEIKYSNQTDFDEVVRLLHENHYIKHDYFVDETGNRVLESTAPDISPMELIVSIPLGCYRNLGYIFPQILANGVGEIVWGSTDGQFQGGVTANKGSGLLEELVDLMEWGNNNMPPEGEGESEEAQLEWMNGVVDEFVSDPDIDIEDMEKIVLLDIKSKFPELMLKDRQVHWSANKQEAFLSLQNGILSLKPDGTWEWSNRE